MAGSAGTLMQVAQRCAVSASTVSRVLNNRTSGRFSVSPTVREKILQAARELGYRPSVAARNLVVGKTQLVAVLGLGLILPDRVGPAERAVSSLAQVLDEAGYDLCVQLVSRRHGLFDLPPLRVDGVVVLGADQPQDIKALEQTKIPYVSINGPAGGRGSLVAPDDAGGMRLAIQHLVELGHRRIAYLDHPSADAQHPSIFERRAAFAQAGPELGFEAPAITVPRLGPTEEWDAYYAPFLRAAVIGGGATAVLAYSHHGAMAMVRTAHNLGLSVPRDFSLVTFNDEPVVRLFVPSITAIDVPSVQMGKAAAELLLRQMNAGDGPAPPQQLRLAETLVRRESSAAPGGK